MTPALLDHLHLPQQCIPTQTRTVPKAAFTRQMKLTARQQRLFTTAEQVRLVGTLTHANTGMPAHIDDKHDVQSILVLTLALKEKRNADELIELTHRAFPHPTILLVEQGAQMLVSAAVPRKSLAEHETMVVDDHTYTDWIDPISRDARGLWPKLAYEAQSHADLLAYVQGFRQNLMLWNLREWLGDDISVGPLRQSGIRESLVRLEVLDAEITQLRALRRNPDTPLRESSRVRVREHRLVNEAATLAERIQGALR